MPNWGLGKPPEYLEPDIVKQLLQVAPNDKIHLLLKCMWQTGGRLQEVLSLKPEDVGETSVILKNLKNRPGSYKECSVTKDLCDSIRHYCQYHRLPEGKPVFRGCTNRTRDRSMSPNTFWRIFTRLSRSIGVYRVKKSKGQSKGSGQPAFRPAWPHLMRHACAQFILDNTGSTELVQKQLGHSSIVTSQVYALTKMEKAKEKLAELDWSQDGLPATNKTEARKRRVPD